MSNPNSGCRDGHHITLFTRPRNGAKAIWSSLQTFCAFICCGTDETTVHHVPATVFLSMSSNTFNSHLICGYYCLWEHRNQNEAKSFWDGTFLSRLSSPNTDDEESSDEKEGFNEEVGDSLEFTDGHVEYDFSSSPAAQSRLHLARPTDNETRARCLIARLRQPFGALLLRLISTDGRAEYKRVAADSMIMVQIQESFPLSDILDNVRNTRCVVTT